MVPAGLVLTAAVSVQAGAGIANRMFGQVPPAAVTALRSWAAAVILLLTAGRETFRAVTGIGCRAVASGGAATANEGVIP